MAACGAEPPRCIVICSSTVLRPALQSLEIEQFRDRRRCHPRAEGESADVSIAPLVRSVWRRSR